MATCAVFDVSTARCRGITGEEEEDRQQPPRRPMGPIPNTFISSSSSSAPAFSSDDDDEEGSSSSFCSSISTLYSSDDEDNQGGGDEVDSSSSLGLKAKSPLSKMSDLMAQLPIKRGLSRHYNGKSQSFTSLATVASVEDLRKPERGPARKKLKSCRSFGGGMATVVANATHNTTTTFGFFLPPPCPIPATASPAPAINKIGSTSSSPLKMATDRSGGFLRTTSRLPPQPLPPQHRSADGFPPSHTQALLFA